jgi:leader peptidase (prepilin peptidase)/N-methyltransferase
MDYLWQLHLIYAVSLFILGTVVGSFLNVCIYRIPWEKSVIWPASTCPRCLHVIEPRDNVPILGWLLLRGACRQCKAPISARYPLIELLVGLLFLCVYVLDALLPAQYVRDDATLLAKILFHVGFVCLLVVITFIDADLTIVPPVVTNTGILYGLAMGACFPDLRPDPATATSALGGLWVGLKGLLVGGGLIAVVRVVGGLVFRREAMGSGDIHILAMVGVFLGWQGAILTFFLAPFIGFLPAIWKYSIYLGKRIRRQKYQSTDNEIPFGPYLSVAALLLLLTWPSAWRGAKFYFETIAMLFWFVLGQES